MVESGTCWQAEILQRTGSFSETVRPLKILRPKSGPTFTGGQFSRASLDHPSITEACLSASQTALRVFHLPRSVPMLTTQSKLPPLITPWIQERPPQ